MSTSSIFTYLLYKIQNPLQQPGPETLRHEYVIHFQASLCYFSYFSFLENHWKVNMCKARGNTQIYKLTSCNK